MIKIMGKVLPLIIMLFIIGLTACGGTTVEPIAGAQPEDEETEGITALPTVLPVIVATNTYIPIVEAQSTATLDANATPVNPATPSPTAEPQPTPPTPVNSIQLAPVASGLQRPLYLTHAFDDRLFILEQVGRIRIIEDGQLLNQPFLDIRDRVGSVGNEQGLLGLAFHPDYATEGAAGSGYFWVNYTDYSGDTHISRFSVSPDDPDRADPASEVVYLRVDQPYANHNGGVLKFGLDGYLYAGLGDGGSANDPLDAGQDLTNILGKILRLDVDYSEEAYAIPSDNPYVGSEEALPEIWAYGLRNPWRMSFDRATGDLYIADVGQNQWEEVNFQPGSSMGGENYGWSIMEGNHCFPQGQCDTDGLEMPIFEYFHSEGCSISGGYVYRGEDYPAMGGNYFVADYCRGTIWRLVPQGTEWDSAVVLNSGMVIPSFGEDVNGELYVLDFNSGGVYKIQPGS
jgi:glucose/arabinose dehydrogenase